MECGTGEQKRIEPMHCGGSSITIQKGRPMSKMLLIAAIAALFSGCAADNGSAHRRSPPQDPADYHGVPTDDRPPMMLETPPRE